MRTKANPTGRATGRSRNGKRTTTAAITQLLPNPTWCRPVADPSWNQDAACTLGPVRLNSVSSTATTTGSPAGTSRSTTNRASTALT